MYHQINICIHLRHFILYVFLGYICVRNICIYTSARKKLECVNCHSRFDGLIYDTSINVAYLNYYMDISKLM